MTREKEISKAIDLIGWDGVAKRLKTAEDKAIFGRLENIARQAILDGILRTGGSREDWENNTLEDAHIRL